MLAFFFFGLLFSIFWLTRDITENKNESKYDPLIEVKLFCIQNNVFEFY